MKIQLKINDKEISLSEETIKEIKKVVEEKKNVYFIPEISERFYRIAGHGEPYFNGIGSDKYVKTGMYAKTIKEAAKIVARMKAVQRVKVWISDNLRVFHPNWNESAQKKYHLYYNYESKKFGYDYHIKYKEYSPIGYLKSEEDCEKLIEACKEGLLIILDI